MCSGWQSMSGAWHRGAADEGLPSPEECHEGGHEKAVFCASAGAELPGTSGQHAHLHTSIARQHGGQVCEEDLQMGLGRHMPGGSDSCKVPAAYVVCPTLPFVLINGWTRSVAPFSACFPTVRLKSSLSTCERRLATTVWCCWIFLLGVLMSNAAVL